MYEAAKCYLILGFICAIWNLAAIPDYTDNVEEFWECTKVLLASVFGWPWFLGKGIYTHFFHPQQG